MTEQNWEMTYEDGVHVSVFQQGMELDSFEEAAYPAFERYLTRHHEALVGSVGVVELDDPFSDEVFAVWQQAAQRCRELPNYQRLAIVADGIKAVSLRGEVDVDGVVVETFEDRETAVEWARNG